MKITTALVRQAHYVRLSGERSVGDPQFRVPEGMVEIGGYANGHKWWLRGVPTPRALQIARERKERQTRLGEPH
jgi:hypothetical protein